MSYPSSTLEGSRIMDWVIKWTHVILVKWTHISVEGMLRPYFLLRLFLSVSSQLVALGGSRRTTVIYDKFRTVLVFHALCFSSSWSMFLHLFFKLHLCFFTKHLSCSLSLISTENRDEPKIEINNIKIGRQNGRIWHENKQNKLLWENRLLKKLCSIMVSKTLILIENWLWLRETTQIQTSHFLVKSRWWHCYRAFILLNADLNTLWFDFTLFFV